MPRCDQYAVVLFLHNIFAVVIIVIIIVAVVVALLYING